MPEPTTIIDLFLRRVAERGAQPALVTKRTGQWRAESWNEVAEAVGRAAAGLVAAGIAAGDRVLQASENRHEWIVCDLAIQLAGAVHVPVHASLAGPQIAWQARHSGARLALISGTEQAAKLAARETDWPDEIPCYSFDPAQASIAGRPVAPFAELPKNADAAQVSRLLTSAAERIQPAALATILYTSGTTGEPKGVMLTQNNLASNAVATVAAFGQTSEDMRLGFLPLSHVFARTCDLYTWLACGSRLALAVRRETVLEDCAAIRPTLINGVPYFFDVVRRKLALEGRAAEPGSLREILGGAIRYCCSGGAPLPDELFDYYHAQGVPLSEGYGLTETSPVISVSTPKATKRGCVGRPVPGVDVKIAPDGEILTRGPHVMAGYWRSPDATAEMIRDGWLHTGDLGALDDEGFLRITGRKKEIIVTAGGKNVAPVLLESLLTSDPLIAQALVVGDRRKCLGALIVPDPEVLKREIVARGISVWSKEQAVAHPAVRAIYKDCIERRLAGLSHYEQIGRFKILDRGFSIECEELTPKLSLRRKTIEEHFAAEIEAMYAAEED
jgi:long-chain acyl-CoA synthetase